MTTPNFIKMVSLPDDPVFLDHRIGQNFLREPLDLLARSILQANVEDLALPNVRDLCESEGSQAALDGHALRIENRRLQRHDDRSFHVLSILREHSCEVPIHII